MPKPKLHYSKQKCIRKEYLSPVGGLSGCWREDPRTYGSIPFAAPRHFLQLAHIEYFSGDFAYTGEVFSGFADLAEAGELVKRYADEMGTDRDRI